MALSMLWTLRLTFNYWLRGGSEDYRWNLIQGWVGTPGCNQPSVSANMHIQ
jgi:steroid 5-alpha reductase family enzyme